MVTVSLCMIVKDEEDVIARCLDSVKELVDEIIIVDTGSADRTKEMAGGYTSRIYDFTWIDDFAAARNFSFSKASKQYCMWLDADDVILPEDQKKFLALKETLSPETDIVMTLYHTGFDEQGNPAFSYYRERLIKNQKGLRWTGAVHEVIPPEGRVEHSDFAVTHRKTRPSDPDRNLRIFEKQLEKGEKLDPRQQFYYGRELYYHKRYAEAIQIFEEFLAGGGWVENEIEACRQKAYCHYALGEDGAALQSLLRSLAYDRPRAEVCCEIGRHFFDRQQDQLAVFWYKQALDCQRDDQRGGFVSPDCYEFIPCIQLCVCYDRLGELEQANAYNERAGRCKPDSAAFQQNRQYFAKRLAKPVQ